MKPPLPIRLLPDRLKASAFYRFYNPLPEHLLPLLNAPRLRYAPSATMVALMQGDIISESIALTGFYELALTRRILDAAKRGGRLVDVGANLGYFSLLWLASNPQNQCVSIEASPRNVPLLRKNINANGFEARCRIEPVAAGKEAGVARFDLGPPNQSGWGGLVVEDIWTSVEVPVRRIDALIGDTEEIAVLKIDIEGADTWALLGCERLLSTRQVRVIYYELHKYRLGALGIGLDDAHSVLRKHGYIIQALGDPDDAVVEYVATAA